MAKRRRPAAVPRTPRAVVAPAPRATAPTWDRGIVVAAAATSFVGFLLYLATTARSVPPGDSGELIAAAWVLGVPHPPGYPTYTVLAHLVSQIPVGSVAFRVNLLSAVLHAAAVGVVVVAGARVATYVLQGEGTLAPTRRLVPIAAGVVGGLLLAVSTAFWSYALVAEVFALNSLLAVLVIWLMIEWAWRPERLGPLWLAAFLSGLAMTNQQTFALLAPGLIVLYVAGLRRAGDLPSAPILARAVGVPVLLALLGLAPYLYLPLAAASDPPVSWGDASTLGGFLDVVTRTSYGTFRLVATEERGSIPEQLLVFGRHLLDAFTPIGLALAAIGVAGAWLRDRTLAAALVLAFLASGPAFVAYANPPLRQPVVRGILERFAILPDVVVGIALVVGAAIALAFLARRTAGRRFSLPAALGTASLVALAAVAALAVVRLPGVDRAGDRTVETYAHDILDRLEPRAMLVMRSDENFTAVVHAQEVEQVRTDVVALDVELLKLPAYVERQRREHPDVVIPFASYDNAEPGPLVDLVNANLDARPVHLLGAFKEAPDGTFALLPAGLGRRVLSGDAAPSREAIAAAANQFFELDLPDRVWAPETWQSVIAANYAAAAFDIAVRLHQPGRFAEADLVARLYREAIRLVPDYDTALKNLGVVLLDNGGPPEEVVAVWSHYLELRPDDPEAGAIRGEVERLREQIGT